MRYDFLDVLCEVEASDDMATVFILGEDTELALYPDKAFGWLLENEDKFKWCEMKDGIMTCMFDKLVKIDII